MFLLDQFSIEMLSTSIMKNCAVVDWTLSEAIDNIDSKDEFIQNEILNH